MARVASSAARQTQNRRMNVQTVLRVSKIHQGEAHEHSPVQRTFCRHGWRQRGYRDVFTPCPRRRQMPERRGPAQRMIAVPAQCANAKWSSSARLQRREDLSDRSVVHAGVLAQAVVAGVDEMRALAQEPLAPVELLVVVLEELAAPAGDAPGRSLATRWLLRHPLQPDISGVQPATHRALSA